MSLIIFGFFLKVQTLKEEISNQEVFPPVKTGSITNGHVEDSISNIVSSETKPMINLHKDIIYRVPVRHSFA